MKLFAFLVLVELAWAHKLENWQDPDVQGSILPEAQEGAYRQPKFFLGTTTTVTATASAASTCFTTAAVTGTCTGRKKRSGVISNEPIEEAANSDPVTPAIQPSIVLRDSDKSSQTPRQSRVAKLSQLAKVREAKQVAEGRFLGFFLFTTTTTSTVTTFTATTRITLQACTPTSFAISACP